MCGGNNTAGSCEKLQVHIKACKWTEPHVASQLAFHCPAVRGYSCNSGEFHANWCTQIPGLNGRVMLLMQAARHQGLTLDTCSKMLGNICMSRHVPGAPDPSSAVLPLTCIYRLKCAVWQASSRGATRPVLPIRPPNTSTALPM